MADDVTFQSSTLATPSAGVKVSTDEDTSGAQIQRVKLAYSADGSRTHVQADADGVLVNLGANNDVTVTGTVTAQDGGGSLTVDGTVTVQDGGNVISVDDGAGSLTVDGTVAVSAVSGVVDVTPASPAANDYLPVRLTDGSSFVSVGGGTQYTEDGASAGGESLTLAGTVRRDSAASSAGTDGDYATLNTDGSGRLWVNASGAAIPVTDNSGTLSVDDGAGSLTVDGSVSITGTVAVTDNSGSLTVDAPVGTPVFVRLSDGAAAISALPVTDNSGSLTVDNAGTFAVQATVAAGATNIAKAEDVASADADVGVPAMAVRKATPVNTSGTDGDYEMLQMSAGRLWVDPSGVNVTVVQSTASSLKTEPAGQVAHDAIDSGNPLKIGGKASTSTPTPVAAADRTDAWFDEYGRIVVSDYDPEVAATIGSTGLRDRLFAQRMTVLADSLADGLATFWTSTTANSGTTTSSGGEGLLQTSANANGSAQLSSTTTAYFPGMVQWFNSAVRFGDTGASNNTRRIGVFTVSGTTPQDGFYYELSGTTLNAVVCKAGSATATASGSWSQVATAPFTLDTNYHSLEIRYTANTVWFYVDNVLRHKVSGTSASITATLNFPITIHSINVGASAANRLIAVRNCGMGRFGNPEQSVNETGLSAVWATAVGGGTPHDSIDSGNPIKVGALAKSSDITAVADADRTHLVATLLGKLLSVPYATPAKTWSYAAAAGGLVTTSGVTIKTAAGAGIRNYVTRIQCINSHQTTSTEVVLRDGASGTVMWRGWAQAAGGGCAAVFDPPLRGTANTLWEVAEVTQTATAGVLVSAQGFEAAE